jgi:hypothetical protein
MLPLERRQRLDAVLTVDVESPEAGDCTGGDSDVARPSWPDLADRLDVAGGVFDAVLGERLLAVVAADREHPEAELGCIAERSLQAQIGAQHGGSQPARTASLTRCLSEGDSSTTAV